MTNTQLFTTGYAGFDLEGFLWKLQLDSIETVVDVRENPVSRNAAFSKPRVDRFLIGHGITYVHYRELGVPSHFRRKLRSDGDLVQYFDAYKAYLAKQQDAIARLSKIVLQRRCCLLCLEKDPRVCHRSVLADTLVEQHCSDIEVKHI